jgi:exosortase
MLALVLSWVGIFVLCFGRESLRTALFPVLFLFGLVPLPQRALDLIIAQLQQGSAWSAHLLFAAFGVPVVQHGVLVTIPGLTVQVAQECSSIRSSSMLLVTTAVLAQVLLRSPWWKALIITLAVPLSIAKNGLRIFTIAMLGTRADPAYLTGKLHHEGGILFFLIALIGIFALLAICQRAEGSSVKAS